MTPIHFVISAPRSGSTWLARTLNSHPEIFATEHRLFGDFCEIWDNRQGKGVPRITADAYAKALSGHYLFDELGLDRPQFRDAFLKSFIRFLAGFATRRSGKKVVVDKVTPYLGTSKLVFEEIQGLLPDSKIFLLMRDGRDVLTSGTFDWLQREPLDSPRYRFFIQGESSERLDRFFDDKTVEQWAKHWREIALTSRQFPIAQTLTYESMKLNQMKVIQELCQRLGVDCDAGMAQNCVDSSTFEKTTGRRAGDGQPTAKARKGIAGDWKNYFTKQDGILFHQIAGEELSQFGYETSDAWIEQLPDSLALKIA